MKSIRIRCTDHVALRGKRKVHMEILWGNLRNRDYTVHPSADRRIILK
jgi:hypothetical protein